jgi:hypothetical protein
MFSILMPSIDSQNRSFWLDLCASKTYKGQKSMAMSLSESENETDAALVPFLKAPDEMESEASLSRLIWEQTESTIREIIRSKLRVSLSINDGSHTNQEALELVTKIQADLLSGLRELKTNTKTKTISNFRSYVAAVTFNACHQWLRRKYPKRLQLKNKLRYLLTHESQFALWEGDDRDWLCGLGSWRGTKRQVNVGSRLQQLRAQRLRSAEVSVNQRQALIDLLNAVFQKLEGAVLLDELVTVVADQLQIREDISLPDNDQTSLEGEHFGATASVLTGLEQRAQLKLLWTEICQLPQQHRTALLLNLRDKHGADMLAVLPLARVATIRQIAEVLGFEPEQFGKVWNELPWDDATIAKHLRLTRQQVINLRHSARARLARRLKHG